MVLDPYRDGGFHFGKKNSFEHNHYIGKPQDEDGHILEIGEPGCYKTSSQIIPTFGTWRGHIIAIDVKPKGDLLSQCERMSKPLGKQTLVFNPYRKDSCRYDPYGSIKAGGEENLARNAMELAQSLISSAPGAYDQVWIMAAQHLLAGVIIYGIEQGASFAETTSMLHCKSASELVEMIMGSGSETAKMFVSKLNGLKEETLAGIGMDLTALGHL